MKTSILSNIVLFAVGFCAYITMEVIFRGYSFPLMGICGGLAMVIIDKINNKISWNIDLLIQGILGAILITLFEFIIGELYLSGILPQMWDYSNVAMNYKGIICLPFSCLWIVISILAALLADAINYYVFNEDPLPYYKLFGKVIIQYKQLK